MDFAAWELPSSGRTQDQIGFPFGWQWQGMTSSHDLIPGDYDGDGKTDRAIVDRAAGPGTCFRARVKSQTLALGLCGLPF